MSDSTDFNVLCANVREVLKLNAGKEIIWHVLGLCGVYDHIEDNNDHQIGRRAVGLDILSMLEDADKTAYPRLLMNFQKKGED